MQVRIGGKKSSKKRLSFEKKRHKLKTARKYLFIPIKRNLDRLNQRILFMLSLQLMFYARKESACDSCLFRVEPSVRLTKSYVSFDSEVRKRMCLFLLGFSKILKQNFM